jgi:hypothetical protein
MLTTKDWNSSLIKWTEYNSAKEELSVVFKNDVMYRYSNINQNEYYEFTMAESQGKFFSKNFRNKPFVKETNAEVTEYDNQPC